MTTASVPNKLMDQSGETLVEALVAILVSSIAMLMLATAIGSAVNIVKSTNVEMARYYDGLDNLVGHTTPEGQGSLAVTLAGQDTALVSYSVSYYQATAGGKSVYAYGE